MLFASRVSRPSGLVRFAVVSMLALSGPAVAQDDLFERLMEKQRVDHWFETLADDVAGIAIPEDGFSPDQIEAWDRAAQTAFDRNTMVEEFTEAMRDGLTAEVMQAALDFEDSPTSNAYAVIRDEVDALPPEETLQFVEQSRELLETESNEQQALYVSLFEAQHGPDQAQSVVDGLYRMMTILAAPIYGDDIAQQWVQMGKDEGILEVYSEEYFLLAAGVYRQVSQEQAEELLKVASDPLGAQYYEVLSASFYHAYNVAIDRLETEFAAELGR